VHHGQPARGDAWEDPAIDARFGGCYGATRATIEAAWIRPRYAGYLGFQAKAGPLVEQHLRGDLAEDSLLEQLEQLHRASARQSCR
jgi:multiple sugar transport system substrate-binding protein